MDKQRLALIEEFVLGLFRAERRSKLLTREAFESGVEFANADLVRAFEDLEKRRRLLVRHTEAGDDWLQLTREGAAHVGLPFAEGVDGLSVPPHPPKSAT